MRIGMLTTSFPRDSRDIAGSFVLGFARALADNGHTIEVLAPEPLQQQVAPSWPGVHTRHVPYLRPRLLQRTFYGAGVPDNLARDPLAWLGLVPFTFALTHLARRRARHWDALISHWALPCALAAGHVRGDRPHIAVLHSADVHLLTRLPHRSAIAARIACGASTLWFVSDEQRRRFVELLPRALTLPDMLVCPMGIDWPERAADGCERESVRRRHQLQGFSVLALGRLVPIKAIDIALRATAQLGMTLLVAGEGPEHGRLSQLATELRADVRFLGNVVGSDKSALFEAADALVLPSRRMPDGRSEGLPNVLLEALSHGLPIVASRGGGITELLGDTHLAHGLVPPDDASALARALAALRATPNARAAGDEACRSIAARYAWPRVIEHAEARLSRSANAR